MTVNFFSVINLALETEENVVINTNCLIVKHGIVCYINTYRNIDQYVEVITY